MADAKTVPVVDTGDDVRKIVGTAQVTENEDGTVTATIQIEPGSDLETLLKNSIGPFSVGNFVVQP